MRVEALIDAVARDRPERLALIFGDRSWSFRQLRHEVSRRVSRLVAAGVRPGDTVVTAEPQTDDLVLTFLACCRADVVLTSFSPLLSPAELSALSARTQAVASFTADGQPSDGLSADRALPLALPGIADPAHSEAPGTVPCDDARAPAIIRPTSGSTGAVPKLVVMTHGQLTWRVGAPAWWESPTDVFYLPTKNHFAVMDVCHVLGSGATLVLARATSPAQMELVMAQTGVTVLLTVPAVLAPLTSLAEPAPKLRLKAVRTSAASLPVDLRRLVEARYGVPVVQLYGSTESGYALATTRADTPDGSIGRPLAHVDARVVNADGEPLGPHAAGELIIRTPGMMLGYLDDPEATNGVLRDGWLWSGDLGRRDENGFFSLLGRRDSRINTSGFKVQPEEIEAVLALHPGVLEVAVTADPDPVRGEAIRAVIVPASRPPSPAELMRFCRARLAAYKVPRRFEFVDHLPRTPLGKLRRSQLTRDSAGN